MKLNANLTSYINIRQNEMQWQWWSLDKHMPWLCYCKLPVQFHLVFFPEYCFTMTEISGKSWDLSLYELHRTPQVTVLFIALLFFCHLIVRSTDNLNLYGQSTSNYKVTEKSIAIFLQLGVCKWDTVNMFAYFYKRESLSKCVNIVWL